MDKRGGLVAKLTDIFNGMSAKEINDVVTEAKQQVTVETVQNCKNELAKLFDSQMKTLSLLGCPPAILELFFGQLDYVLFRAVDMPLTKGHIPFVPVIPSLYMGVYGLMRMVRNSYNLGTTQINPNEIVNNVEVPKDPYFIYDVEDGEDMLGKSSEDAEKLVKEQNRFCLTVCESIALCIHSKVLSKHYVNCTGSSCVSSSSRVFFIFLDDGEPTLSLGAVGDRGDEWGSASCRIRC